MQPKHIVAVDTGGTFTDLVLWDGEQIFVHKVLSTPGEPSRAVLMGLAEIAARFDQGEVVWNLVIHGSTVATNAVLERRGARTAFITNQGFSDLLLIGRQNRQQLYDLEVRQPEPLVSRHHCFGVQGRVTSQGITLKSPDPMSLQTLVAQLKAAGPFEAVAVCLLHSYLDASQERVVARALREAFGGLDLSLSCEVFPQWREVERASTTVLNAYVQPKMRRYLSQLESCVGADLRIIQSDGGMVGAKQAQQFPVHTLLSGPAGGVVGAHQEGKRVGHSRVISLDMGGTSTDVSLISDQPLLTNEGRIGDLPLAVTAIDIHTVGAGGGSIARCDAAGVLKVGPHSAGADPGPACYGKGGPPTVTDAHCILGRLPEQVRLAGRMPIDAERALAAMEGLARQVGRTAQEVARGILDVVNAHMVRAIKVISLERGYDPRDFTLMAFGGAGGLHACELADQLRMTRVLIPPAPGLMSAMGMLGADYTREFPKTVLRRFEPGQDITADDLERHLAPLAEQARGFFEDHGVAPEDRFEEVVLDLRYQGQSYELCISETSEPAALIEAFHQHHQWRYGYRLDHRPVQWVSVRLRARGRREKPSLIEIKEQPTSCLGPFVDLISGGNPVVARVSLERNAVHRGPMIITEYSGTTWVPRDWQVEVLAGGTLLATKIEV